MEPEREAEIKKKGEYHERALVMGRNLRALRLRFGITQIELAKKLHTSVPLVSQLENGVRAMGPRLMARISRFFNVSETYFLQRPVDEGSVHKESVQRDFYGVPAPDPQGVDSITWEKLERLGTDITPGKIREVSEGKTGAGMTGAAWFTLPVKKDDNSMEPEYRQGDIIVVNTGVNPSTGEEAVVLVKKIPMVRKVIFKEDRIVLKAYNPNFEDIILQKTERGKSFEIVGRVMELRRPK